MNPALTGLLAGLSLIIAIGAQNAFVIRQGLARNHVLAIVLICAFSDTALISSEPRGWELSSPHSPG
jgi:L-lysine exporter family protein LysE/ArgO